MVSFIKLKKPFPKTKTLKSSSWDKSDVDQNPYRYLKRNIDPFLICTVEALHQCWDSKSALGHS